MFDVTHPAEKRHIEDAFNAKIKFYEKQSIFTLKVHQKCNIPQTMYYEYAKSPAKKTGNDSHA